MNVELLRRISQGAELRGIYPSMYSIDPHNDDLNDPDRLQSAQELYLDELYATEMLGAIGKTIWEDPDARISKLSPGNEMGRYKIEETDDWLVTTMFQLSSTKAQALTVAEENGQVTLTLAHSTFRIVVATSGKTGLDTKAGRTRLLHGGLFWRHELEDWETRLFHDPTSFFPSSNRQGLIDVELAPAHAPLAIQRQQLARSLLAIADNAATPMELSTHTEELLQILPSELREKGHLPFEQAVGGFPRSLRPSNIVPFVRPKQ